MDLKGGTDFLFGGFRLFVFAKLRKVEMKRVDE